MLMLNGPPGPFNHDSDGLSGRALQKSESDVGQAASLSEIQAKPGRRQAGSLMFYEKSKVVFYISVFCGEVLDRVDVGY